MHLSILRQPMYILWWISRGHTQIGHEEQEDIELPFSGWLLNILFQFVVVNSFTLNFSSGELQPVVKLLWCVRKARRQHCSGKSPLYIAGAVFILKALLFLGSSLLSSYFKVGSYVFLLQRSIQQSSLFCVILSFSLSACPYYYNDLWIKD
jgi:hypothetical protein